MRSDDPFEAVPPAEAADRFEAALRALGVPVDDTVVDPEISDAARAGGAAGVLFSSVMNLAVQAGVDGDGEVDLDMHRGIVTGIDTAAGELRENQLYLWLNILELWAMGERIGEAIGPDQGMSVAGHCEAAKSHMTGHAAPDTRDEDEGEQFLVGDDRAQPDPALAAEFTGIDPDPVTRLSRACMPLGILPAMKLIDEGADFDPRATHPGYRVALVAGVLTGRATLEMVNACRDIHDADTGPLPMLWSKGFRMSLSTVADDVDDTMMSGALMRLVNMIGAWHYQHAEDAGRPRSGAVADLLAASLLAARADSLAGYDVDLQAEFIATRGVDTASVHRDALDRAEAGLAALKAIT